MPDRQFYGAIIWYHLMAPFYGMCVPGIRLSASRKSEVRDGRTDRRGATHNAVHREGHIIYIFYSPLG